ncbi:MAG: hypothetical protein J6A22_03715 [Bacteroidales bacterium]|nr:hypothetical protein [Bacteroidales bacterium]
MKNLTTSYYISPEIRAISFETDLPVLVQSSFIDDLYKDPNDFSDYFE